MRPGEDAGEAVTEEVDGGDETEEKVGLVLFLGCGVGEDRHELLDAAKTTAGQFL